MNIIPQLMPGNVFSTKKPVKLFKWTDKVIYYSLGRAALLSGTKLLKKKAPNKNELLVPAFICEETLWPLRDHGFTIKYYSIDDRFNFFLPDIESKINKKTLAVMAVHYFGVPADLNALKELCGKKGAFLIEDCAHAFYGEGVGLIGDFSFFSIRKFIPVPDGGALLLNNQELQGCVDQIKLSPNRKKDKVAKLIIRSILNLRPNYLLGHNSKRGENITIEKLCPRADIEKERRNFIHNESMSGLSQYLLLRQDFKQMAAKRRNNYDLIADRIGRLEGVSVPYPKINSGWSPYVLPVLVEEKIQKRILLKLISNGIGATDWPMLPADLPPDEANGASSLMRRIILLPVHQNLNKKAAAQIEKAFLEGLS